MKLFWWIAIFLVSCGAQDQAEKIDLTKNFIHAEDAHVQRVIGSEGNNYLIMGSASRAEMIADAAAEGELKKLQNSNGELSVGFPESGLGQKFLFGGVITKAAHRTDSSIGNLKLSDVEPMALVPRLKKERRTIEFYGCAKNCVESNHDKLIMSIRVIGAKEIDGEKYYVLKMADFTKQMKIVSKVSNFLSRGLLVVKNTEIESVDYQGDTFVFDVRTDLGPLIFKYRSPTSVTSRWYLRPAQPLIAKKFVSRKPLKAVGFFKTQRNKNSLITRFPLPSEGKGKKIRYYLKNVPKNMQPGMRKAFEDWNELLLSLAGEELLEYKFIGKSDREFKYIQTGDVRFNVLEWDTVNKAAYGGLGPSIAYQGTGQILSGNVLIQGPSIEKRYRKWFGLDKEKEKTVLVSNSKSEIISEHVELKLNDHISFRIPALMPEFHDPQIAEKDLANPPPKGVSYQEYMFGYMRELTAHEIGHNLGLRHNFKGNLGASESPEKDLGASRSVMDYLGNAHRHLVKIGEYDRMAMAYGYAGKNPKHDSWFCTDQDVISEGKTDKSPECQRYDLTADPFGYWLSELRRSRANWYRFGRAKNQTQFRIAENLMGRAMDGSLAYAAAAEKTSSSWTNWSDKVARPSDPTKIQKYVSDELKKILCKNPNSKPTLKLSKMVRERAKKWGLKEADYHCRTVKVIIK